MRPVEAAKVIQKVSFFINTPRLLKTTVHVFSMIFYLTKLFTLISWQGKHFDHKMHLTSSEDTKKLSDICVSWIECQITSTLHHKLLLRNTLFTHYFDLVLKISVFAHSSRSCMCTVCICYIENSCLRAYLHCEWTWSDIATHTELILWHTFTMDV